jgi:hypothetical protein
MLQQLYRRYKAMKTEKKNKYGVKVGEVFLMTWGYEQTNNNFFQVVALAGDLSVRVVEVDHELIENKYVSSMAADRIVNLKNCMRKAKSFFIKDQEKGDLKRIKPGYGADRLPIINITSYADARLERESIATVYDSNYY